MGAHKIQPLPNTLISTSGVGSAYTPSNHLTESLTDVFAISAVSPAMETTDDNSSDGEGNHQATKSTSTLKISIKSSLILLLLFVLVISVIFLTIVWVSSFAGSVTDISNSLLESQFSSMVDFIDTTMNKVAMAAETVRNSVWNDFDYYNRDEWIFDKTFMTYKSQEAYISGLFINSYFGDILGGNKGITSSQARAAKSPEMYLTLFVINSTGSYYKNCDYESSKTKCVRKGPAWDKIKAPFDVWTEVAQAQNLHNSTGFSESYTDSSYPLWVWFSCVSVHSLPGSSNFDWYFAIDLTVHSLSEYLLEFTSKVTNSLAVVIEISSNAIIATNYPDIPVSEWDKNGGEKRKTVKNFNVPQIREIGSAVYESLGDDLKSLKCSTFHFSSVNSYYVGLYRLCTPTLLNWMIIFAIPQWNYVSSIVIAVIVAVVVSIIITISAIVIGVWFSTRIVTPFNKLMAQFEFISDMQLDEIEAMKVASPLKEVSDIQEHVLFMVKKMKLFRSFLPPHLLSKLDNSDSHSHEEAKHHSSNKFTSLSFTKSSSHQSKYGTHTSGFHNSIFKLGLEKRRVVSGMIYFEGLNELLNGLKEHDITVMLTEIFSVIQRIAGLNNALVGNFEKSSIILSFNATSECTKAEEKGLFCLTQLQGQLLKLKCSSSISFLCAMVSQKNKVGNVGTRDVKTFSILGSYQENLEYLIKLTSKLNLNFLISEKIHSQIADIHTTRLVSWKKLLNDNTFEPIMYNRKSRTEKTAIFEVGDSKQVSMDECK